MARRLNFAVIGCGMLARSQHIPNLAASGKAALHTCCDLSDEALAECRDRHGARRVTTDYRAAVRDPEVDAICICVPTPLTKTRDPDLSYVTREAEEISQRLRRGQLVMHPSYGMGRVLRIDYRPGKTQVRVRFNVYGEKTIILEYSALERVDVDDHGYD